MSAPKIVEGLEPCEDCGAPWVDEGNGTPVQAHTDKCWTAPRKPSPDTVHDRKTIRNVPEELWQSLRLLAAERNTYISKLVIEAIRRYLRREYED